MWGDVVLFSDTGGPRLGARAAPARQRHATMAREIWNGATQTRCSQKVRLAQERTWRRLTRVASNMPRRGKLLRPLNSLEAFIRFATPLRQFCRLKDRKAALSAVPKPIGKAVAMSIESRSSW